MIRTIATLVLFIACVQAKNVTFTNCVTTGTVNWVDVSPCDNEPCTFKPGQDVTVTGEMKPGATTSSPKLSIEVEVLGFWTPYPGIDSDGCKYVTCPITEGQVTPFTIKLTTLDWLPAMNTKIRFELLSDDTSVNCAQADIVIA